MSTPSTSPPGTPGTGEGEGVGGRPDPPSTPPNPPAQIKLTLPTPPSFAAHRRSHSITSSPASKTGSPQRDSATETPKRGHNRSVSFNHDVEIKTISPEVKRPPAGGLYRIPQRSPVGEPESASALALASAIQDGPSPRMRKGPPSALTLGGKTALGTGGGQLLSPWSRGAKSAPLQSRFASTAAARGLSIAPALAKMKDKRGSTQGLPGSNSIWSAGVTSTGGWITPGLGSARSTTTATGTTIRQRGLSVAVMKDGKEMLVDSGPITPGLPNARRKSIEHTVAPIPEALTAMLSPRPQSATRPKEVILCRYYHTPGLTCTSRPCRFVHSLSTIPTSPSVDTTKLRMLSPTKSPDYTMGTFAQAQDALMAQTQTQTKTLNVKQEGEAASAEIDVSDAQPGETVVLSGASGTEMVGTVFYMSGGGKGPAGKSKAKYKTVACREYSEGYCPYGDSCSFIHESKTVTPPPTEAKPVEGSSQTAQPKAEELKPAQSSSKDQDSKVAKTESKPAPIPAKSSTTKPRPPHRSSAWLQGPPKLALKKPKEGLSAFAAPYSTKPLVVASAGQVKEAQARSGSDKNESKAKSAWAKGPPAFVKTVRVPSPDESADAEAEAEEQEIELPIPTPSHAHLLPPISAWTVYSTDSDPAALWDPAVQPQQQQQYQHNSTQSQRYGPTYPWGMPMTPVPMSGDEHEAQGHHFPGGPGVLWTPSGWAVQDAAMKRAMASLERADRPNKGDYQPRTGAKSYYRKRPCKFFAEGHCPHGDECTYLHVLPTAISDPPSSSDSDTPTHSPTVTRTLPCKFFNSQAGCHRGSSCTFLHTIVIPQGAVAVTQPRPWRTRPCRHFQLARCNLGATCHFAHVADPNFVLPEGYERTANTTGQMCYAGVCARGEKCKFVHYRDPSSAAEAATAAEVGEREEEEDHSMTEDKVEELRRLVQASEGLSDSEEEDDEDDVQIVTSASTSISV